MAITDAQLGVSIGCFWFYLCIIPLGIKPLRVTRFVGFAVVAAKVFFTDAPPQVGGRQALGHLLLDKSVAKAVPCWVINVCHSCFRYIYIYTFVLRAFVYSFTWV